MSQSPRHSKAVLIPRFIWIPLLAGASVYLFICLYMLVAQRSFLYYPRHWSRQHVQEQAHAEGLERWTNSAGQFIGLQRLSPRQPTAGAVMLMYGNGSTALSSAHYARDIQSVAPWDVFILEYPGYADRGGKPSQSSLFQAAEEAFQMLPANKPIYLVGESLGSGVAAHLAGTHPKRIAGLALISPFNNLTAVAQNHFPFLPVPLLLMDRFNSDGSLRHYGGKVAISLDGRDAVVPERFGRRLFDGYSGPKKLWEFPDGGHCQIMEPQAKFWKEIVAFWQSNSQ